MCVPLIYSVLRLFILVSPKDNLNNLISATSSFSSTPLVQPLPCTALLSLLFSTSDASSTLLSAVDLSLNASSFFICNPCTVSLFYPGSRSFTCMYSVLLWLTCLLLLSRTYLYFSWLSFPCILVSPQITISANMEVQGARRGSGLTTDAIPPPS